MSDAYTMGFVKACEARGIDPEALVKQADEENRHGILKGVGAAGLAAAPNMAIVPPTMKYMTRSDAVNPEEVSKLLDQFKGTHAGVGSLEDAVNDIIKIHPEYAGRGAEIAKQLPGPHFNPATRKIYLPNPHNPNMATLSHELGHSTDKLLRNKGYARTVYTGSQITNPIASLVAALSGDRDTGRRAGIAGSATSLPMLAHEMYASGRGAKALGRIGRSLPGRLKAFAGVPTYATLAAMPYGTYKIKDMMGGYKTK